MSGSVGELFVNLGIKGTEKTVGALHGVAQGMGSIVSTSLEAKAAILAAMYGLEKLLTGASDTGQKLANLSAISGISTQTFQKYEFAANRVGVSTDALDSSLTNLLKTMYQVSLGKGPPQFLAMMMSHLGGKGIHTDLERFSKDADYALKLGQQMANLPGLNRTQKSTILSSVYGEAAATAMMRNAFNAHAMGMAPTNTPGAVKGLTEVGASIANAQDQFKVFKDELVGIHGKEIAAEIDAITVAAKGMAETFERAVESIGGLLDKLGIFKVMSTLFQGAVGGQLDKVQGFWELLSKTARVATPGSNEHFNGKEDLSNLMKVLRPNADVLSDKMKNSMMTPDSSNPRIRAGGEPMGAGDTNYNVTIHTTDPLKGLQDFEDWKRLNQRQNNGAGLQKLNGGG